MRTRRARGFDFGGVGGGFETVVLGVGPGGNRSAINPHPPLMPTAASVRGPLGGFAFGEKQMGRKFCFRSKIRGEAKSREEVEEGKKRFEDHRLQGC